MANRQAILSNNLENQVNSTVSDTFGSSYTPAQLQARELYDLGFNVFPQPFGKKFGLPWKQLQYTRLDATDTRYGVEALHQGKCNIAIMCGRTSGNLLVIDCETQDALNHHIAEAKARSIPLWVVETARGGHIYLTCIEGEVANIDSNVLNDAEVRGCNGYVLAAGSVHPSGVIYQWLIREGEKPPHISANKIDWLVDKEGNKLTLKIKQTKRAGRDFKPLSPLSRATQDYLNSGDLIPEGNRNNRLFSAACDMAGNGYSQSETEDRLAPIAERSGLDRYEVYSTIRSAFSRSRNPARPNARRVVQSHKEQSQAWQQALAFAQTHTWTGRAATSTRLVFFALIERARMGCNENGTFRASVREISEIARLGTNATQAALKRLCSTKIPYIIPSGLDSTSQARLWKFSDYVLKPLKNDTSPRAPLWTSYSDSLFNSDAAERGALGYNGVYVYRMMLEWVVPLMPLVLAARLSMPVHRVNYALKKLSAYSLVRREKKGWVAVPKTVSELDEEVALPAGKLGKREKRRRIYAEQRALYVGRIIYQARLWRARANPQEVFFPSASFESAYDSSGSEEVASSCIASAVEEVGSLISNSCSNGESSLIVEGTTVLTKVSDVKLWRCPNCGQVHFADVPPDMCDFCQDLTTWKPLGDELPPEEVAAEADDDPLADPLIQLALELGAEVYIIEDGEQRLIASNEDSAPPDG
jgi:hypothetical protein